MWSREAALRLRASEDFRALFEDEESPLLRHIESLERIALNPAAEDREALVARARLAGIWDVFGTPARVLDEPDNSSEKGSSRPRPVARTRYLRRTP